MPCGRDFVTTEHNAAKPLRQAEWCRLHHAGRGGLVCYRRQRAGPLGGHPRLHGLFGHDRRNVAVGLASNNLDVCAEWRTEATVELGEYVVREAHLRGECLVYAALARDLPGNYLGRF